MDPSRAMSTELANIESLTLPDLTPAVCAALVNSGKCIQEENLERIIDRVTCRVCGRIIDVRVYSFRQANAVILGFRCHGTVEFAAISIDAYEKLESPVDELRNVVPRNMAVRPQEPRKKALAVILEPPLALPEVPHQLTFERAVALRELPNEFTVVIEDQVASHFRSFREKLAEVIRRLSVAGYTVDVEYQDQKLSVIVRARRLLLTE